MRVSKFILIPIIGAFILMAWLLYNFFHRPEMTLTVRFTDTPPVIRGILRGKLNAYYRGYKVGEVSKIRLSDDQKYLLFSLDIYYKNLILPKNTRIYLKTQDIFGDRYFDLVYPSNPSNNLLSDGDIVAGTTVLERLDQYLVKELESGTLGALINNLAYFSGLFRGHVQDPEAQKEIQAAFRGLNKIIETEELQELVTMAPRLLGRAVVGIEDVGMQLPLVSENVVGVNRNIEQANENIEQVSVDIRQASTNIRETGEDFDQVSEDMQLVSGNIKQAGRDILGVGETISETNRSILAIDQNLPLVNQTVSTANSLLCNTNNYLHSTNSNLGLLNTKIPEIPPSLLENADETIKRYNCIGVGLSKMLSKRFLLFRLLFGNPGEFLDECIRVNGDEVEINPECFERSKSCQ